MLLRQISTNLQSANGNTSKQATSGTPHLVTSYGNLLSKFNQQASKSKAEYSKLQAANKQANQEVSCLKTQLAQADNQLVLLDTAHQQALTDNKQLRDELASSKASTGSDQIRLNDKIKSLEFMNELLKSSSKALIELTITHNQLRALHDFLESESKKQQTTCDQLHLEIAARSDEIIRLNRLTHHLSAINKDLESKQ